MNRLRSCLVLLVLSGCYMLLFACQGEDTIRTAQYITNGHKLYVTHCQNCHGAKGEGLGRLYPPLTDSEYLEQHRQQLPAVLRHGMSGEITVQGVLFDTEMPPNPQLTNLDIAYILTYVTNTFGNKSGIYSLEEVEENLSKRQ